MAPERIRSVVLRMQALRFHTSTAASVCDYCKQGHGRAWDQGFFGADCGNEAARLVWDTPLMRENVAFEYDFFQLPDLNPSALTHSIEVRFTSVFYRYRGNTFGITICPGLLH